MLGKRGLDEHLTRTTLAPGAAGDLDNRLRHAFCAAKIRAEQTLVCVDDSDKRELWKVMSFGQHLRTDQDISLALPGLVERFVHRAFALSAVAVNASNRLARKSQSQGILEAFGTFAQRRDVFTAFAATRVERPDVTTVVAAQLPAARVHRQAGVAAITAGNMTTAGADQCRSKAAPVQENKNLTSAVEMPFDRFGKGFAEPVGGGRLRRIDETNRRWFCATRPRRQFQVLVVAAMTMLQHLQRRRSRPQDDRNIEMLGPDDRKIAG